MIISETESLYRLMLQMAPLPESEWELFAPHVHLSNLQTGEALVHIGDDPHRAGFVVSGLLKAYYLTRSGEVFIRSFTAEGQFAVSFTAILGGARTSDIEIVAIERTAVLTFDFREYQKMLPRHWAWQQIGRIITEQTYILRERRQFELLTLSARARLESFMLQFPGMINRISQKELAAFIGINPVSLSRLRGTRGSKS